MANICGDEALPPATTATASSAACPQLQSSFLTSLPAELRNHIYGLTFSTSTEDEVDLLASTPPSKNLLLACKKVYNEARGMQKAAYRKYWCETSFVVAPPDNKHATCAHTKFESRYNKFMGEALKEDIANITKLRLVPYGESYCIRLMDGVFSCFEADQPDIVSTNGLYVPYASVASLREASVEVAIGSAKTSTPVAMVCDDNPSSDQLKHVVDTIREGNFKFSKDEVYKIVRHSV